MSDDEGNLEVVELSGAVIRSFYKDIPMFVFRANGGEPTMSRAVAFVAVTGCSSTRTYADIVRRNVVGQKRMNIKACVPIRRTDDN